MSKGVLRQCVVNIQVAQLAEANVRVYGETHEENKRRVQEDETRLSDMRVVYKRSMSENTVSDGKGAPKRIKQAENAAIMFE